MESILRIQECPISNTHLFANACVAKPSNRLTIAAPLRLDKRACVVLPSPIHGRVALDENLRTLNGVFLSAKSIF